jgi:hypothetical protein
MNRTFNGSITMSSIIPAPANRVYAILADYHTHHPSVIPKQYFKNLVVEEGGVGAGTRTRLDMEVLGTKKTVRHIISEPEPGHVLMESDVDGSTVTRFIVESLASDGTNLTISTQFRTGHDGFAGKIERWLTVMMLKRIYRLELANIAAYAARQG